MSEVDGRFVKQGLWTNLDQGEFMGRTITTDTRTGIIIIAIMAVMSTLGTSHLWNLMVFVYHQTRAHGRSADGLFRQQQAVLRTLPSPSALMADSVKLWWFWRKRNNHALRRSLLQFLLGILCTTGFVVAGIFSSYVVNTTDLEVLVKSPLCGRVNRSLPLVNIRMQDATLRAYSTPYAQECYRTQDILPARCKAFVRPNVPFTANRVACPFDSEYCLKDESDALPAVALDSGPVDLNEGFGMNLPKKERVSYRRRTTCAVLPVTNHITVRNASDLPNYFWGENRPRYPEEQAVILHYGERPTLGEWKNITVLYSLLKTNVSTGFNVAGRFYSAARERAGLDNEVLPAPGLRPENADLTLMSMLSSVSYVNPVHDPWFLALKEKISYDGTAKKNHTMYIPDTPGKVMACTLQDQFCIKTSSGHQCSELNSRPLNMTAKDWPEASALQLSVLQLLVESSKAMGFSRVSEVLAAKQAQTDGSVSVQIPPDQWVTEAKWMESFVWASMQVTLSDFAIGPNVRDPDVLNYVIKPTSTGDKQLCGMQKMRKAGGFVNVNVFGMAFIISVSLFLTLLDILVLKFFIFLSGFRKALSPRLDRWIQDGVLQLQRRAYEAEGQGTWSNIDKDVPLTEEKEMLAVLPLRSSTFPIVPDGIPFKKPQLKRASTEISMAPPVYRFTPPIEAPPAPKGSTRVRSST